MLIQTRLSQTDGDDINHASHKLTAEEIGAEGIVAIVAGTDTSAITLSHTIYLLLRHPKCLARLREEINARYPGTTDTTLGDFATQAEMPYLNACM